MTDTTTAERLGTFAATTRLSDAPPDVVERAKACLVHGLTVGMAGLVTDLGHMAEQLSAGWVDKPQVGGFARSLVTGRWHAVEAASFINGVLLHARAQEDTHGTFHPGVCVIPAALAAAEDSAVDGATVLAAVIAGYEVGITLSDRLTESTTPPFRATAVFGPIAAAAAVGRIKGFDPATMASAIALAASFSGGTSESFGAGTDEWHFQSGTAAATGMRAAHLAAAGVTTSPTAFEATAGFLDCFAPRSTDRSGLGDRLGQHWNILGVTFKPYPVCAFNQTPALLAAQLHHSGVRTQDISSVVLTMNEREATYPGMPATAPFTSVANTLMSARFAFAAALTLGDITYPTLTDFEHLTINDVVGRVELVADTRRAAKTAHAQVILNDGSVMERAIEDSLPLLSWDMAEVRCNAARLADEVGVSPAELHTLTTEVQTLDHRQTVRPLVDAALAMATTSA